MPGDIDFVAGQILTAAQLDTVMGQTVVAVPSGSYPTTVHEGRFTFDQTDNRLYVYDGGWVRTEVVSRAAGRTGCFLRRTSNQSIANASASPVDISWDTENTDSDGFIAVTGTTVTVPSGLGGIYSITNRVVWASNPATLGAYVQLDAGGETFRTTAPPTSTASIYTQMSAPNVTMVLGAGDTITLSVYQTSGGALNVTNAKIWVNRLSV